MGIYDKQSGDGTTAFVGRRNKGREKYTKEELEGENKQARNVVEKQRANALTLGTV